MCMKILRKKNRVTFAWRTNEWTKNEYIDKRPFIYFPLNESTIIIIIISISSEHKVSNRITRTYKKKKKGTRSQVAKRKGERHKKDECTCRAHIIIIYKLSIIAVVLMQLIRD